MTERAALRATPDPHSPSPATIVPNTPLIVIAPQENEWVWVYSHAAGRKGYVHETTLVETTRPVQADTDPMLARFERGPSAYPSVAGANAVLLTVSFGGLGAVWLLAILRVCDLQSFAKWSANLMLATIWLIDKNFWPPHVVWAIAPASLAPVSPLARLAVILSATVLSIYVSTGADMRIYTYRSVPAFLLPLACFGLFAFGQSLVRRRLS